MGVDSHRDRFSNPWYSFSTHRGACNDLTIATTDIVAATTISVLLHQLPLTCSVSVSTTTAELCVCVLQIGFKYPHSKVDLLMNSTAVPGVVIAPNQLQANFTGDIALYARTPTGQTAYLFTLNVVSMQQCNV